MLSSNPSIRLCRFQSSPAFDTRLDGDPWSTLALLREPSNMWLLPALRVASSIRIPFAFIVVAITSKVHDVRGWNDKVIDVDILFQVVVVGVVILVRVLQHSHTFLYVVSIHYLGWRFRRLEPGEGSMVRHGSSSSLLDSRLYCSAFSLHPIIIHKSTHNHKCRQMSMPSNVAVGYILYYKDHSWPYCISCLLVLAIYYALMTTTSHIIGHNDYF